MSEVKRDFTDRSVVDCFQQEVEIVVETYKKDGLKLGEAIGALELVKLDLWKEQTEEAPSLAQEEPPQNTMEAGQNNGQQAKVSICQHAVPNKYMCLNDGLLCQGQCGVPTDQAC